MAEQLRPTSREQAPDPSHSYERSHPAREPGMGKLHGEADKAVPEDSPDKSEKDVPNRQDGNRQINAHDVVNRRDEPRPENP